MMRFLRHPATNACCLSLFTAFYAAVFFLAGPVLRSAGAAALAAEQSAKNPLWKSWCGLLAEGRQDIVVCAAALLTAAAVVLLVFRRHPYDEYHTALLTQCLAAACVLTLLAIAVFFVLVLANPAQIVAQFALFITIHWLTVVLADLAYVVLCRWR